MIALSDCPKFSLPLKSHTKKKRLLEAKNELMNVYPFEVSEENILIVKSDRKNFFDVYISKEKIRQKADIKKMAFIIFLLSLAIAAVLIVLQQAAKKNMEVVAEQKRKERQRLEEEKMQKEKEEKLERLKNEYIRIKDDEYEKIYPYIERIYSAMTEKTTVENISIDKNIFTIEVTAKDAVQILSNFEKSNAFSFVKMNRTSIKDKTETVTFSGEFSRFIKESPCSLSVDEQTEFYEGEISRIKGRTEKMSEVPLSEYVKNIRDILRKNNCSEQYIQLRGKEKSAQVEFFILSSSKSILQFISEIQNGEENLIDIKSIKIHNSREQDKMQTTICFDSGIELKQDNEKPTEYTDKEIDLASIDRIFYKEPFKKNAVSKTPLQKTFQVQQQAKQVPSALKKLTYIGLTKSNGKTLVIVKDEDMQSIYKLALTDTQTGGDFCIETDTGYRARLRGEYYEVKK